LLFAEFCQTFPAYTVEMVLKMPYETFIAMLEASREMARKTNEQLRLPEVPQWPKR
jgi:hypothetical protein